MSATNDPVLRALFEAHRLQVILSPRTETGQYWFSSPYVYAVAHRMYPAYHEEWHGADSDPYETCYSTSRSFILGVLEDLDARWLAKQPIPSFYEIERSLGGREHRIELMNTLRYSFLDGQFDADFWAAILQDAPAEAHGITREFSDRDIYLP